MKLKLFAALGLLLAVSANAKLLGYPFIPEIDQRFNLLEGKFGQIWNITAPTVTNNPGTGFIVGKLPANSQYTAAWLYIATAFVSSGGSPATISLGCGTGSNILVATDFTAYPVGSLIALNKQIGAIIGSNVGQCNITAVTQNGGASLKQGKANLIIDYIQTQ